jgi:probable O-glycosylation ligase (exosortase A-associated)
VRDLIVFTIVMLALPLAFRRPYVGLLLFSWLAYMRPNDLCWSFAREMRFSFYVGFTMVAGWFAHEAAWRPFFRRDFRTLAMLLLAVLTTTSLVLAENRSTYVLQYYIEFVKIVAIALFTTGQVDTRERLRWLLWTIALCLGFYGVKGGLFGLLTGGSPILRGPGGMLEDNNDFALALVMNLPLLFYLGLSERRPLVQKATRVALVLTLVTIVLTHSRGGFLALVATVLFVAWRSRRILAALAWLLLLTALFFLLAPQSVIDRLATLKQGTQESSAGARLKAWGIALRMIEANPVLGVGIRNFQQHYHRHENPEERQPEGSFAYVAHNSYLQVWAEGGTIAFTIYLMLLASVFLSCRRMRLLARARPDLDWVLHYARMFEATTVGFMVGAVFLNRGHFDLIYHWFGILTCLVGVATVLWRQAPATADTTRRAPFVVRVQAPATVGLLPRWGR